MEKRNRIVFALKVSYAELDGYYHYGLCSEIANVTAAVSVEQNLGWEIGDTLLMDLHLPGVGDEVLNDDGEPTTLG